MKYMQEVDRQMLAPKAFYFMFYAAMASLLPYLVLYYSGVGLSASQIGLLVGIGPLITLIAAPFWGGMADNMHRHKLILVVTIIGAMIAVAVLSQIRVLWMLVPIVSIYAWFAAPIVPLVDNSVLAMLGNRRADYGRHRMWGAIGWGITGLTVGIALDASGHWVSFAGYLICMGATLFIATRLQVSEDAIWMEFWHGLRLLALNRRWLVFLSAVWIASIGAAVTFNFLFLYLQDMGATRTLMGWSLMVATLSEIPVFYYSNRLLNRWGATGLLLIAMAAYVVRLAAYALMPSVWFVLPIQALHGMTFAAMWVAGVSYAYELAPPGLGATAQGLFTGVTMGLGTATGALVGGLLYDLVGPEAMFMWVALVVALGMFAFWVSEVARKRSLSMDAA